MTRETGAALHLRLRIRSPVTRPMSTFCSVMRSSDIAFVQLRVWAGGLLMLCGCSEIPDTCSEDQSATQSAPAQEGDVRFVDVGRESGLDLVNVSGTPQQRYMAESASAGAAFLDYDGDGFLDLFFVNGTRPGIQATNRLYRNVPAPSGRTFAAVDVDLGPGGWGMGCTVGDVDNDGDPDVYVTYLGPNRLYRNDAGERFADVAGDFGVADDGWGASAAFGDLDGDGYLDLYVTNYVAFDLSDPAHHRVDCPYKGLQVFCGPGGFVRQPDKVYRNLGDGFEDLSAVSGIDQHALPGLGVALADLDDDGDLDIYVANDTAPNLLFRNDGDWHFAEVGLEAGVAFSGNGRDQAGMGVHASDYDNDGRLDLFVTNFADDVNTLYRNEGDLQFSDVTYQAGLGGVVVLYLGWGTGFFDYDNDGWLDLYVANGHLYPQLDRYAHGLAYAQRNLLYHNRAGQFVEVGEAAGPGWSIEKVSRGAAVGDYDNDGDPDLLITNLNEAPTLLHNEGSDNAWLGLDLVGAESNRDGIGARVRVTAGGQQRVREVQRGYGFQTAHDDRLLFGLGALERVERVEIDWPSGQRQVLEEPPLRHYLTVREGDDEWTVVAPVAAGASVRVNEAVPSRDVEQKDRPVLPPGMESWTPYQYAKHTSRLFDDSRYVEVRAILEVGVGHYPNSIPLRFLLGQVLVMGLGSYEDGMAELDQVVRKNPDAVQAHACIGWAYLRLNRLPEAIGAFRRAIELQPFSWEYLDALGMTYLRADSLEAAAQVLRQAVEHAPWEPNPHLQLVRLYQSRRLEEEAQHHRELFTRYFPVKKEVNRLLQRLKERPQDATLRSELALQYVRQGRLEDALTQFKESVMLDPHNGTAYLGMGSVLYRMGRLDEAIRNWETLLQKEADHPQARSLIDRALTELQ